MTANSHSGHSSLAARLAANAERIVQQDPQRANVYDELIQRLIDAGAGSNSIQRDQAFPSFLLPDHAGRLVASGDLLKSGPLIISFNRGHWCTFCKIELAALQALHSDVVTMGGKIVAITPERQEYVCKLRDELQLTFPVLTDIDNGYALSLGLAVHLGEKVRHILSDAGVEVGTFQGNENWIVPIPATCLVGQDGRVLVRYVDPDFRNRITFEEILGALKKHGHKA